jgi:hypothetical protein
MGLNFLEYEIREINIYLILYLKEYDFKKKKI